MKNPRYLALLTSLAATPAFSAPFLAIGENAELFLTATTSIRHEDNIDFSPDGFEQADEIFEFVPGIELSFGKNSLTSGTFAIFERFVAYSDNTQFNDELFNALFDVAYEGAKITFSGDAYYREQSQTTQDVQAIIESTTYGGGGTARVSLTEKTSVGIGASYGHTDNKTALTVDRTTYSVPVNYFFAIRPKVDLSAGLTYTHTDVDAALGDSDDYYFNVGAQGEFTPKLSGNFDIGYTVRESDGGLGASDSEGTIGLNAGLDYAWTPKTGFSLDARRGFDTGSFGQSQETTSVTLGASSALTTALSVNASVAYTMTDYSVGGRTDDFIVFNTGANYTINQHVTLSASYSHYDNSSDVAPAEFSANIFSLSANFRY